MKKKERIWYYGRIIGLESYNSFPYANLPPSVVARTKRVEKVRVNLRFNKPELRKTWIRSLLSGSSSRLSSSLLSSRLPLFFSLSFCLVSPFYVARKLSSLPFDLSWRRVISE